MKKLSPVKRKRVEYLAITSAVFVSTALFFGLLFGIIFKVAENMQQEEIGLPVPSAMVSVFAGLAYGAIISMFIGGIILFTRFISTRPMWFKILAAVLWPITYMSIGLLIYVHLVYWFYNLVKLFIKEKKNEVVWQATNYQSVPAAQPTEAAVLSAEQPTEALPAAEVNNTDALTEDAPAAVEEVQE